MSVVLLSNRPHFSVVYRLINHVGCWKNTRRFVNHAGEWLTNSSTVLPTSQVVYQPINHKKTCGLLLLYNNSEDTRNFHGFTGTTKHSWLNNQSGRVNLHYPRRVQPRSQGFSFNVKGRGQNPRRNPRSPRMNTYKDKEYLLLKK